MQVQAAIKLHLKQWIYCQKQVGSYTLSRSDRAAARERLNCSSKESQKIQKLRSSGLSCQLSTIVSDPLILQLAQLNWLNLSFKINQKPVHFEVLKTEFWENLIKSTQSKPRSKKAKNKFRLSSQCQVQLIGKFFLLTRPQALARVSLPDFNEKTELLTHLLNAANFQASNSNSRGNDRSFQNWTQEEVSFHFRTRGFSDRRGKTFSGKKIKPAKSWSDRTAIRLSKPKSSPARESFADVLKRRRSHRGPSVNIKLKELSHLLYLSLHKKQYPSAGGLYENRIYLAVRECEGLAAGFYFYDQDRHQLRLVTKEQEKWGPLISSAADSWGKINGQPQIVLVISCEFGKLTRVYETICYRLTLLNAGVIMQNIALAASALKLTCCPLGSGEFEKFSAATNEAWQIETSVAELAIGGPI